MATATTTHQVIDPRGDLLLCFPGRDHPPQNQLQLPGPGPGLGAVTFHHGANNPSSSTPSTSPSTICADINLSRPPTDSDPDSLPTNQDAVFLQVSSSVLCLASPVFSAMLSGPLSEGLAFRSPTSPRPFPLTLPEDCGATFAILASILHFRTSTIPFLPSTPTLLSLARLADKYGCTSALTSHAEIWMHRALDNMEPSQSQSQSQSHPLPTSEGDGDGDGDGGEASAFTRLCSLLLFAYAMDLPGAFARISWEVMLHHRQQLKGETEFGLDLPVPACGAGELLRHDLHGEIAKRKSRLRREIHAALMEPITRVTSHLTFPRSVPSPSPAGSSQPAGYLREPGGSSSPASSVVPATCPNAVMAMGNYMAFLDAHNLCPWRPQYETDSFASIIARAMDAANQARDDPALRFEMCSRSRCRCSAMAYGDGVHLAQRLAWAMGGAMQLKLFACLDCLKNGNDGHGTCRVKHS